MMSRSFGDQEAHKIGVISIPVIKKFALSSEWKGLVLSSDGLTEKLSISEISQISYKWYKEYKNANKASKELIDLAKKKWPGVSFFFCFNFFLEKMLYG